MVTNLLSVVCLAASFWLITLPGTPEPPVIQVRYRDLGYAVAESMGCLEVGRVCRAHKRQEPVKQVKK
jgi:hypothetical protein